MDCDARLSEGSIGLRNPLLQKLGKRDQHTLVVADSLKVDLGWNILVGTLNAALQALDRGVRGLSAREMGAAMSINRANTVCRLVEPISVQAKGRRVWKCRFIVFSAPVDSSSHQQTVSLGLEKTKIMHCREITYLPAKIIDSEIFNLRDLWVNTAP